MKKQFVSIVLALAFILSLAACGGSSATSAKNQAGSGQQESSGEKVTIKIMWQQEITETFMEYPIEKLKEKYPEIEVELVISPQAYSEINNLMAAKNAPDVFFTWFSEVDYYGMMQEGLLNPVDEILAMETAEGKGTLGEKIISVGIEQGQYEDNHYLLPVTQYTALNFYNADFLAENTIEPKLDTMAEFEAACKEVAGKTQATSVLYAGVYSFMVMDSFIFPLINNIDPAAVEAINNGEEGAWTQPSVVEAITAWENLVKAGYVSADSLAMDHIQSQIEFINNRAAFVPVGTWLEGEMGDQWPEGFELTPFLAPTIEGKPHSVVPVVEYMILPKQQDDSKTAYVSELVQLFYSEENALKCLEETGALMAYEKVDDQFLTMLPASVQAAFTLTKDADKVLPSYKLNNKPMFVESVNLLNALTAGEITAQEFCESMDGLI